MYATTVDLDGAYPNFLKFRHSACAGNSASPPKMWKSFRWLPLQHSVPLTTSYWNTVTSRTPKQSRSGISILPGFWRPLSKIQYLTSSYQHPSTRRTSGFVRAKNVSVPWCLALSHVTSESTKAVVGVRLLEGLLWKINSFEWRFAEYFIHVWNNIDVPFRTPIVMAKQEACRISPSVRRALYLPKESAVDCS